VYETEEQRDRRWTAYHDMLEACRKRRLRRWRRMRRIIQALRWVEQERKRRGRFDELYGSNWTGPAGTTWGKFGER